MLDKAKREIDGLADSVSPIWAEPNPVVVADLTYNAACTLWHVTDWVANASDPKLLQIVAWKGCTTPNREERAQAFQRQLRSESHELRICWALALRFKHFELEERSSARGVLEEDLNVTRKRFYGAGTAGDGERSSIPIYSRVPPPTSFSAMPQASVAGFSTSTLHPKVTYRKQRLRLLDVYQRAYSYLDRLLKRQGL